MKYTLNPGWTREKVKKQIEKYNDGSRAAMGGSCMYLTPKGNRCAVGCFIPDEHPGLYYSGDVYNLLEDNPDLVDEMPCPVEGLKELQQIHDKFNLSSEEPEGLHDVLFGWIDEHLVEP